MIENRQPRCPVCGEPMRQIRRGSSLAKRGPSYICPVAESERMTIDGRLVMLDGAEHKSVRTYEDWEV